MAKKSKLYEKPGRMPDLNSLKREEIITQYINEITQLHKESAKSQRFTLLLYQLFGVEPQLIENYISGIEKSVSVKHEDRILKGRVDELFGNLIIEFECDLRKSKDEAEEQLKKYVAYLWTNESEERTPYLCIATDGINFSIYSPLLLTSLKDTINPHDIKLEPIEPMINLSLLTTDDVYFFLDRYFLAKKKI